MLDTKPNVYKLHSHIRNTYGLNHVDKDLKKLTLKVACPVHEGDWIVLEFIRDEHIIHLNLSKRRKGVPDIVAFDSPVESEFLNDLSGNIKLARLSGSEKRYITTIISPFSNSSLHIHVLRDDVGNIHIMTISPYMDTALFVLEHEKEGITLADDYAVGLFGVSGMLSKYDSMGILNE